MDAAEQRTEEKIDACPYKAYPLILILVRWSSEATWREQSKRKKAEVGWKRRMMASQRQGVLHKKSYFPSVWTNVYGT